MIYPNDTIKIKTFFNNKFYTVDTNIKTEFIHNQIYYLADDYNNPTELKFVDYNIGQSINYTIVISLICLNLNNNQLEYYTPNDLYKTKKEAQSAFYQNYKSKGEE